MQKRKTDSPADSLAFLRDVRFIRAAAQIIFAILVIVALVLIWTSVLETLRARNLVPNFTFLERRAGFQINQRPDWYTPDGTYGEAFVVGVLNTISVVTWGLLFATILGVLLGIFLLSRNWLIRNLSRSYVEILRNTPLLVQLVFWYFVVMLGLPEQDITIPNESVLLVPFRLVVYLIALIGTWFYSQRENSPSRLLNGLFVAIPLVEIVFYSFGSEAMVISALGILGLILMGLAMQHIAIPESQKGFVQGLALMLMIQFVGHGLLDMLFKANAIGHPQLIYGEVIPALYFGRRGLVLPEFIFTVNFMLFGIALVLALVVALGLFWYVGRVNELQGKALPQVWITLAAFLLIAGIGWFLGSQQALPETVTIGEGETAQTVPLETALADGSLEGVEALKYDSDPLLVRLPQLNRFGRLEAGVLLSPSYIALLVGLVIYTSAFIGEIVRAGIQAVPFGQIEAARALGLSGSQTLRMIVLPQALRVIIPPMGNQYLNLAKNSSLATVVAFADTYQVGQTVMNQSGQSITGFAIILAVYLTMSLLISLGMNYVNSRFQLVTR